MELNSVIQLRREFYYFSENLISTFLMKLEKNEINFCGANGVLRYSICLSKPVYNIVTDWRSQHGLLINT